MEHQEPIPGDLITPSQSARDAELLERYIATAEGNLLDDDLRALMVRRPELVRVAQELRAEWQAEMVETNQRGAAVLEKLLREQGVRGNDTNATWRRFSGNLRPRQGRSIVRWAVSVGVAMAVAWGIRSATQASGARAQTFTTPTAAQSVVTLHDGTRVVLAPQTTLTVAGNFGRTTRTVTLTGEAYFAVKTATGRPFIVQTGLVSTRVLGTTFAIRHYRTDDLVQIAVSAGKVEARGRGKPVTVAAGALIHVIDSTGALTSVGSSRVYTDWTNGQLVFDRTPVPAMLATLGRWYGYDFRLADPVLLSQNVSAVFKVSDPVEMMTILKGTLGVNMTFQGKVITLQPRQHRRQVSPSTDLFKPSVEMGR